MTTKPRAKKFRIRRSVSTAGGAVAASQAPVQTTSAEPIGAAADDAPVAAAPAQPKRVQPKHPKDQSDRANARTPDPSQEPAPARTGDVTSARVAAAETDIDAIRREGLTGRQLRMARRVAQKHELPATSDFDAVRLLRKNGIDPFKRSNMLELVVPQGGAETHEGGAPDAFASVVDKSKAQANNAQTDAPQANKVQLPQTVPRQKQTLPAVDLSPAERRNREIGKIQRDIMLRRRRKLVLLLTRLSFFVMLPTIIVGWYFYFVATPMYSSKAEFLILQADNAGGSGLGGLLTGTQFATNQDAIATQSFLQSIDAMIQLDEDVGYKTHFLQDWIDPIQRLEDGPTNEVAFKTYSKNTSVGYDPTEGVIRMEVTAADPVAAADFATRLISYAENQVNQLSQKKRGNQMQDAMGGFDNAQIERRKAQEALVTLQQKGAILDPEGVIMGLRSQINAIEVQLQEKGLQLAALLDNARPNKAKVDGVKGDIRRLNDLLAELNARMVDASQGENSLASLSVRIQMAQADLATRDMMLQSALQQVEQTRMEANRQVRYLTISVAPVVAQEPSYPRKFENTILAFLIFSGIYLMLSLTASILREQVTS
jgi:capsular polysaccharide transport system permease protein